MCLIKKPVINVKRIAKKITLIYKIEMMYHFSEVKEELTPIHG